MLRNFLILIALVVSLVLVLIAAVSPPAFWLLVPVPAIVATVAHPAIKFVSKLKAPTPKLLCGVPASICTLLISTSTRLVRDVIRIPLFTGFKLNPFCYVYVTGLLFLSTQLNC